MHRMGFGSVVRDDRSCWIFGVVAQELGRSAFVAVKNGLSAAWDRGFRQIVCESDNAELVCALGEENSEQFVAHLQQIKELQQRNCEVGFHWVPRECNMVADCLAKTGLWDPSSVVRILEVPMLS